MGRTAIGDWFGVIIGCSYSWYTGMSNHINTETQISEALRKDDAAMTKAEHLNLIFAVEEAAAVEEEEEELFWSLAEDRDIVLHQLLLAADIFAIGGVEYCGCVIQKNRYEETKREAFAQLVLNNLSKIRVYFMVKLNCHIKFYLIGKTANQDWLGIHTEVVWT